MSCKKAFKFYPDKVRTKVFNSVSLFVPDMSLSLPEIMSQFAFVGSERLSELVNRGYDGDEDSEGDGTVLESLDFAEIHDRLIDITPIVTTPQADDEDVSKDVTTPSVESGD